MCTCMFCFDKRINAHTAVQTCQASNRRAIQKAEFQIIYCTLEEQTELPLAPAKRQSVWVLGAVDRA